jgi:retinol dehydrogenase-12
MSADIGIVVPWGRIYPIRKDVAESGKRKEEGGTGVGLKFWEWTEEQIKPYL